MLVGGKQSQSFRFVSIEFVFKFTLKLSSSRLLTLPLKDMQKAQTIDKALAWIHWGFFISLDLESSFSSLVYVTG